MLPLQSGHSVDDQMHPQSLRPQEETSTKELELARFEFTSRFLGEAQCPSQLPRDSSFTVPLTGSFSVWDPLRLVDLPSLVAKRSGG